MKRAIWFFLALQFLVLSCAPVRQNLGEPVTSKFAMDLMSQWQERASQVSSVKGLAKVSVRTPVNDFDGNQVILAEMPARLRAETLSPFGAPLMTLAVDDGLLGVMLPAQNVYYTGTATADNLGSFINLPLESEELVSIILYQPIMIAASKVEGFALTDGGWLLVRYGEVKRQELVFDGDGELKEVAYFKGSDPQFRAFYSKHADGTRHFPSHLLIELPESYATVTLDLSDFETNSSIHRGLFRLGPSPGAKVIALPN